MNEKKFINELELLGITLSDNQLLQFQKYYELLVEWNEKINLTTIIEKEQVYLKHFYDSATLIRAIDLSNEQSLCDVGTGAGFPGIVLKIIYPNLKITLIDSLNKRIIFLNEVIRVLELKDIVALHERGEDYAIKNREKYDVVTARALANLPVLLEICIPLLKVGKTFIPMKANISQEIIMAQSALTMLSCTIEKEINFSLPIENSLRTLLVIKKEKITNGRYPRKYSEIKKKHL